MPQKHDQAAQRKRRTTGHNNSRAEIRNQSAYGKSILITNFDNVLRTGFREVTKILRHLRQLLTTASLKRLVVTYIKLVKVFCKVWHCNDI
jgi:hypothetical protein